MRAWFANDAATQIGALIRADYPSSWMQYSDRLCFCLRKSQREIFWTLAR